MKSYIKDKMNYIGSKKKLLPFIFSVINSTITDLDKKIFCDLFAGTGTVGSFFKDKTKMVISNDLELYSYIINKNLIESIKTFEVPFGEIQKKEGFIFNNYCPLKSGRKYFTDENGKIIDWLRTKIEEYKDEEELYFFLLASLLEATDKIANTASVYGAYLKNFKKSAQRELSFLSQQPAPGNKGIVFNKDANELIKNINGDILFLDPPYNQRQYGANYHLLNTIAEYIPFEVKGVTGLPKYNKSDYSKTAEAIIVLEELIYNAKFKYIYITYNNEGIIPFEDFEKLLKKFGKYTPFVYKGYQRFKADTNREHKAQSTNEYVHFLHKKS